MPETSCEVDARTNKQSTPFTSLPDTTSHHCPICSTIVRWMNAREDNSTDVAQLLLQHNCEVNARDKDNWTPLHKAAETNCSDVAHYYWIMAVKVRPELITISLLCTFVLIMDISKWLNCCCSLAVI
jgi:hypothetical protein